MRTEDVSGRATCFLPLCALPLAFAVGGLAETLLQAGFSLLLVGNDKQFLRVHQMLAHARAALGWLAPSDGRMDAAMEAESVGG